MPESLDRRVAVLLIVALVAGVAYLLLPETAPTAIRASVKTAPVLCMALAVSTHGDRFGRLVLAGLLCSSAGDVLLALPGDHFVQGLVAFLLAHLAYIAAFVSVERRPAWAFTVPFAVWGLGAGAMLWPRLGAMRVPVMAYLVVILTMLWRASARLPGGPSAVVGALGAVLFGISDTLLAVNKFHTAFPGAGVAVMATYYLGQVGIAGAVLLRR